MFVLFFVLVQSNVLNLPAFFVEGKLNAPSDTVSVDSSFIFLPDTADFLPMESPSNPPQADPGRTGKHPAPADSNDTLRLIPQCDTGDSTSYGDTLSNSVRIEMDGDPTAFVLPDTSLNDTISKDTTIIVFPDTIPLLKASDVLLWEVAGFETESEISFASVKPAPPEGDRQDQSGMFQSFIITYETKDSVLVKLKAFPLSELYQNMMLSSFKSTYSAIFSAETQKSRGTGLIKDIDLPIENTFL